jgi:hypothetical protein
MRSLVEYILSVLFPPQLDGKLTHEELHLSLDFRRRNSRPHYDMVWSSAGNVRQHPAKRSTFRERRSRALSNDIDNDFDGSYFFPVNL